MLATSTLKRQLHQIVENEYSVPEQVDPYQLALEMLANIGSIDSELRDELIYTTFWTWVDQTIFTVEQCRHFLTILMDEDHLFNHLGEQNSDTVFTRAFSALAVQSIIRIQRRDPFLTNDEMQEIKKKVLLYFDGERDLRGYVEGKGWAHAIAHASDVLEAIAYFEAIEGADLLEILYAIANKAGVHERVYIHQEDERMVDAVISVLNREILSQEEIVTWLQTFIPIAKTDIALPESVYQFINVKNFLRSLYFRLLPQKELAVLCQATNVVLNEICEF